MDITALPLELLLGVARYLEARDYLHLAATCRYFHQTLQSDKLAWLVGEGVRQKASVRLKTIQSSNRTVLSHALVEIVRNKAANLALAKPLLDNGASFARVCCGAFLEESFRKSGPNPRLKLALENGASLWDVSCGLGKLLEDTIRWNGISKRTAFLLQYATLDDVPCGKDALMLEVAGKSGASAKANYLIQHGGDPPDKAKYLQDVRRIWGVGPVLTPLIHKGYAPSDAVLGEILQATFWKFGPGEVVDQLLAYDGLDFNKVPGGINNLLKLTLEVKGLDNRFERAEYLLHMGGSLHALSPSLESVIEHILAHYSHRREATAMTRWLLERGATLDRVPNGVITHLENVLEWHGPGGELQQLEQTYGITLDQVEGGLDRLLLKHFLDPGESRTNFLLERGASLPDKQKLDELLEKSFIVYGPGPKVELLLENGASFQDVPMGLHALLQRTICYKGKGGAKDYLVAHGAIPQEMPDGIDRVLARMKQASNSREEVNWLLDAMTPK